MVTFLERLLEYYGLTYEDYQKLIAPVDENNFAAGHSFNKMDEAVAFVKEFVANQKKIIVYGDYDADGIMATSIIVKMFKYVDYVVDYYIPNRSSDGYGINLNKSKELVENSYDLVITVDNGISAFEAIDYLKENGVSVVVLDHHEMQEKLPNCDFYLHPILSEFGSVASSAGFVSFMFASAFLGRYDKYLATLGSISVISDMMPLKEYNRNLLRLVIQEYRDGEFFAIDCLKGEEDFNETTIGMRISPRINSVGRLCEDGSANKLIEYFTSDDRELILNYISWIDSLNDERKELSKNSEDLDIENPEELPCFVLNTNEKEGIIGLIANRLVTNYKKPTIIFAKSGSDGILKGSCRVPEGYNIVKIFSELSDLMTTFGGHALAGGCSIKEEDFEKFKEKFTEYVINHPAEKVEKKYITLLIKDLTFENLNVLKSFSPFGEAMRAPMFVVPRIKTSALMFSRNSEHILTQIGTNTKLTGFNFPKSKVTETAYVNLVGTMRKNEYRGFTNLEFLILDVKPLN